MKSRIAVLKPQRERYSLEGLKYSPDPLLHSKVESVLQTVDNGARRLFLELPDANKQILADFLNDMIIHDNPRPKPGYISKKWLMFL